jgi:hypothetical protein
LIPKLLENNAAKPAINPDPLYDCTEMPFGIPCRVITLSNNARMLVGAQMSETAQSSGNMLA